MYQQLWTVHDMPSQLQLQILGCKFFPVAMQLHALSELVPEALLVGLQLLESESHHWCHNQTLQNVGGVGFAGQQPIMMAWYAHKIRSSAMMAWLARYDETGCWWKGNDVHVFTTLKSV